MDIDVLAKAYVDYLLEGRDYFDDWADVDQVLKGEPEVAWQFVLKLVELAAGDHDALGRIGAGPLEDLLRFHPARLLDRAESEATTNSPFRSL